MAGGAGFYDDVVSLLLSADARAAWDTADLYAAQLLAEAAEAYEGSGRSLDVLAAALAALGYLTDENHLFAPC